MHTVACFFAREPGWRCLQALHESREHQVVLLYTHRRKPSSEDPARGERPGYARYQAFAEEHGVPLYIKDTFKEAANLHELAAMEGVDFIVSCNWKFKIPVPILKMARLGTVNLHRGKLPEYRGLEPVRRALEDGRERVYLSAHVMEEEYDTGELIHEVSLDARLREGEGLHDAVARLKRELYPHYPRAMMAALQKLGGR